LDYIFVGDNVGLASTNFMQLALKSNTFIVITQCNHHYTIQGHSRSPLLVPIDSHIWLPISEY